MIFFETKKIFFETKKQGLIMIILLSSLTLDRIFYKNYYFVRNFKIFVKNKLLKITLYA